MTNYPIRIDTDGNAGYNYNAQDDLVGFTVDRGRGERIGIADSGTASITLKSTDGKYYLDRPEAVAGLAMGRRIAVQCIVGEERVDLFRGRITRITPVLVEPYGQAWRAEIDAEDAMQVLGAVEVDVDMMRGRSYSNLISQVLKAAKWKGQVKLRSVEEHGAEFAWFEDVTALAAITEIKEAEGGTFFIARDGTATDEDRFWRRRKEGDVKLDISDLAYDYSDIQEDVITRVRIRVHEYTLRPLQEVWSRGREMKLKSGDSREFFVDLSDPVIRGSIHNPQPNKDYKAYNFADKKKDENERENMTSDLTFKVRDQFATWAKIFVKNTHNNKDMVISKLRLRGKPIKITGPMTVRQTADDLSVITRPHAAILDEDAPPFLGTAVLGGDVEGEYIIRKHEVDNRLVQKRTRAEGLGRFLIGRLSQTQPRIAVSLKPYTEQDILAVAKLEISHRVRLDNDALGIHGEYWIDRIEHEVTYEDEPLHHVRLELSPAYDTDPDRQMGNTTTGSATLTG